MKRWRRRVAYVKALVRYIARWLLVMGIRKGRYVYKRFLERYNRYFPSSPTNSDNKKPPC